MSMLEQIIQRQKATLARGAEAFAALDGDQCMLCDAWGADKRSLFIDCGYAVDEVIVEALAIGGLDPPHERGRGYYLLLCKSCRGRMLEALGRAADECRALRGVPKDHDGYIDDENPDRNIPVRVLGVTKMLTAEEYESFRSDG